MNTWLATAAVTAIGCLTAGPGRAAERQRPLVPAIDGEWWTAA